MNPNAFENYEAEDIALEQTALYVPRVRLEMEYEGARFERRTLRLALLGFGVYAGAPVNGILPEMARNARRFYHASKALRAAVLA